MQRTTPSRKAKTGLVTPVKKPVKKEAPKSEPLKRRTTSTPQKKDEKSEKVVLKKTTATKTKESKQNGEIQSKQKTPAKSRKTPDKRKRDEEEPVQQIEEDTQESKKTKLSPVAQLSSDPMLVETVETKSEEIQEVITEPVPPLFDTSRKEPETQAVQETSFARTIWNLFTCQFQSGGQREHSDDEQEAEKEPDFSVVIDQEVDDKKDSWAEVVEKVKEQPVEKEVDRTQEKDEEDTEEGDEEEGEDNFPTRPPTSYNLFCNDYRPILMEQFPNAKKAVITKKLSAQWKDEAIKQKYTEMFEKAKKEYDEKVEAIVKWSKKK